MYRITQRISSTMSSEQTPTNSCAQIADEQAISADEVEIDTPSDGPNMRSVLTRYHQTVFYHANDLFESAVAMFAQHAQTFPLGAEYDRAGLAEVPGELSPSVIIFDHSLGRDELLPIIRRGFQRIHVFVRPGQTPPANIDIPQVQHFGPGDLYDHVVLDNSLAAQLVVEKMLCALFAYKSDMAGVNADAGLDLITGLQFTGEPLGTLHAIGASWKGLDLESRVCMHGSAVRTMERIIARERVVNGALIQTFSGDGSRGYVKPSQLADTTAELGELVGVVNAPDFLTATTAAARDAALSQPTPPPQTLAVPDQDGLAAGLLAPINPPASRKPSTYLVWSLRPGPTGLTYYVRVVGRSVVGLVKTRIDVDIDPATVVNDAHDLMLSLDTGARLLGFTATR